MADVGKDGLLDEEKIVGLSECATSFVLVVVSSELLEINDLTNVGNSSLLKLEFGLLGVARKNTNFSGSTVTDGLGKRKRLALHATLDGDFVEDDFDSHRRLGSEQGRLGSRLGTKLLRMLLQRTSSAEYLSNTIQNTIVSYRLVYQGRWNVLVALESAKYLLHQ